MSLILSPWGSAMTAVNYPDREADSESGRFTIEARSPYNGTISLRDGHMPSEDDFAFKYRQHQSEFRYRLLDNAPRYAHGWVSKAADSKVVWERFQKKQEDSPQELLVSDDGWSVIRTHGFTPEVIAVRLDGLDVLRVRLTRNDGENDGGDQSRRSARPVWPLARLLFTTAGQYWSANSSRRILPLPGRDILRLAGLLGSAAGAGPGTRGCIHGRATPPGRTRRCRDRGRADGREGISGRSVPANG